MILRFVIIGRNLFWNLLRSFCVILFEMLYKGNNNWKDFFIILILMIIYFFFSEKDS